MLRKRAIIGDALDKYVELQERHPHITMGVGLGASLVPGAGTAMMLPNISHSIYHGKPWLAMGQTGQAALDLVPGLGTVSRIVVPTAVGMGGSLMQQHMDQQHMDAGKAASYGGRLMSQQTKSALAPLLAAAVPAAKAALPFLSRMAGQAAIQGGVGAAMQGVGNKASGRPLTEGMGSAAAMGGIGGAMQHGAGELTNAMTPKTAFAQHLKAAQQKVGAATIVRSEPASPLPKPNTATPMSRGELWKAQREKLLTKPKSPQPKTAALQSQEKPKMTSSLLRKMAATPQQMTSHPGFIPSQNIAGSAGGSGSDEGLTEAAGLLGGGGGGGATPAAGKADQGALSRLGGELSESGKSVGSGISDAASNAGEGIRGLYGKLLMGDQFSHKMPEHMKPSLLHPAIGAGLGAGVGGATSGGLGGAALGAAGGGLGQIGAEALARRLLGVNPALARAIGYGGAGLGGLAGGLGARALSDDKDEKRSYHRKYASYRPRLLLATLTKAAGAEGQLSRNFR